MGVLDPYRITSNVQKNNPNNMFLRRALTNTISRRTQATNKGKPALRFTYNKDSRVEFGKQMEPNPNLFSSLNGAFFMFTVAPVLVFDIACIALTQILIVLTRSNNL